MAVRASISSDQDTFEHKNKQIKRAGTGTRDRSGRERSGALSRRSRCPRWWLPSPSTSITDRPCTPGRSAIACSLTTYATTSTSPASLLSIGSWNCLNCTQIYYWCHTAKPYINNPSTVPNSTCTRTTNQTKKYCFSHFIILFFLFLLPLSSTVENPYLCGIGVVLEKNICLALFSAV